MPEADKAPADALDQGVNSIKETAKWTLGALAAVAAAIIVGLQLTGLGKLEGSRLWLAGGGFLLAIVCILVLIGLVTDVLLEGTVTTNMLEGAYTSSGLGIDLKLETGGFPTIPAFLAEYQKAINGYDAAQAPGYKGAKTAAEFQEDIRAFAQPLAHLLSTARFLMVRQAFKVRKLGLFLLGALAALCITVFAWAINPPAPVVAPGAYESPSNAVLVFAADQVAAFQAQLGKACITKDARKVQVIVLAFAAGASDVVSVPSKTCASKRFSVTETVGILWPVAQVKPKYGTPSTTGK